MNDLAAVRFWARVVKTDNCWLWQGALKDGYGAISIDSVRYAAHRFSWMLSNGAIPVGLIIMHKCDVRNCVNPEHLQLGTQSENIKDAYNKGRVTAPGLSGDAHYNTKIPDAAIPGIRARAAAGEKYRDLATEFGVTSVNIGMIVNMKTRCGVKIKENAFLEK